MFHLKTWLLTLVVGIGLLSSQQQANAQAITIDWGNKAAFGTSFNWGGVSDIPAGATSVVRTTWYREAGTATWNQVAVYTTPRNGTSVNWQAGYQYSFGGVFVARDADVELMVELAWFSGGVWQTSTDFGFINGVP